jgi:sulfur carrier protein
MDITINGEACAIEGDGITILALLKERKVQNPEMVSVQLNGGFVSSNDFDTTAVKNNDTLDYLYFMSGG